MFWRQMAREAMFGNSSKYRTTTSGARESTEHGDDVGVECPKGKRRRRGEAAIGVEHSHARGAEVRRGLGWRRGPG